ncbi:TBC1 domain member 31, partial [Thoreauomyces humboldtii]
MVRHGPTTARQRTQQPPRSVFVGDVRSGPVWRTHDWNTVLKGAVGTGSILRVNNETVPEIRKKTAAHRKVSFTRVCFSRELASESNAKPPRTSYAVVMAAVDQRGAIYAFDFQKNKFWIVAKSGISGSCIAFNPIRRRELIVGLSDHAIVCYNIDSCQIVCKLPAYHTSPTYSLSTHPTRPLLISTGQNESILWDTETWERKRLLVGAQLGIQQARYSSTGASIVTAFVDGKILVWNAETFLTQWSIDLATMLGEPVQIGLDRENCLALSRDAELMVYGGIGAKIYVWNMVERRLVHEILVPAFEGKGIAQIEFLGSTRVVALLSDEGALIFVEVSEARFVGQVEPGNLFKYFTLSSDGRLLSTILKEAGSVINVVRIDRVLDPTPPDVDAGEVSIALDELPEGIFREDETVKRELAIPTTSATTLHDLMDMQEGTVPLNDQKLKRFLLYYGSYPEKYRTLIWRVLARLPENRASYEALLEAGTHRSWKDFRTAFPVRSDRVAQSMERVLSALACWSPVYQGMEVLPAMVFPFVKMFLADMFAGFEIVVTVLVNWCQKWWEYYPNPPIEILDMIEGLLEYHDKELLDHFVEQNVTSQTYAWTMMRSLFSSIFNRTDWLTLWDHLLTNPPWFMYVVVVAFLRSHRVALLGTFKKVDFE